MNTDREQAADRIGKLKKTINEYRHEYHVNDRSTMPEAAADGLKKELADLESQFPDLITDDSPTQRIAGEPLAKFTKAKHSSRMLSLNDIFSADEIDSWIERIAKINPDAADADLFVDLKYDGVACALHYQDGQLIQALTRGDGTVGEVVTANIRTIDSIPLVIDAPGLVEVRGEIVIHKSDFDQLNKNQAKIGEDQYKNPRNLAAGTIRQLDPALVSRRPLTFYGYHYHDQQTYDIDKQYAQLKRLGFRTNASAKRLKQSEVAHFISHWQDRRTGLNYNTDGAVVKINDVKLFEDLGVVGKAPRAAVAFKYPAEEAVTKIKDIIVSIGRTGAATPVALMDPVNLDGTTVQNASLHNQDEIDRKDIRIGDTVIIFKAGDIIPQVQKVLTDLRDGSEVKFSIPDELEKLSYEFERPEGEAVWRVKRGGGEMLKRSLQHYASRVALDIEGLGEKNVEALIDAGLVESIADIYRMQRDDVLALDRFADISTDNLLQAIDQRRQPEFDRFLIGLGIRHVGAITARDLASQFGSLDKLMQAGYDDLANIDGIGEIVAHSLLQWFSGEDNQDLLSNMRDLGVWPQDYIVDDSLALSGKHFVVTGSLESMSRDEAADKIRALGGIFQSSVGKNTDYLVAGAKTGKSKLEKAEKYGTTVLSESEFETMI